MGITITGNWCENQKKEEKMTKTLQRTLILMLVIFLKGPIFSQPNIDIIHYDFLISLSDSSDRIHVNENVLIKRTQANLELNLDLQQLRSDGKGMQVAEVKLDNKNLPFTHSSQQLKITLPSIVKDSIEIISINYSGIPADGLIIGKNIYDQRTFFGDNWPTRARHWMACIDHPSEKATVDFRVKAPLKYRVIANGKLEEIKILDETSEILFHYSSKVVLPSKVMVIGVAEFAIKNVDTVNSIPVSSWVYAINKEKAYYDLDLAPNILRFYSDLIAPYEFEKLANVQSTTKFGGMENAGCIFYDEKALTGKRNSEQLIAHEIAHQWFGNSATESDWPHLWLSEGFATYMTALYLEKKYGKTSMHEQLKKDRARVIAYHKKIVDPIVDTVYQNPLELLNANSYQKGSWVLHMLRKKVGETAFFEGMKTYYSTYRLSNADTKDFQRIMESVSGLDLDQFFQEWLYSSGHPQLKIENKSKGRKLDIVIHQKQANLIFHVPLTIEIVYKRGQKEIRTFSMETAQTNIEEVLSKRIKFIHIDPYTELMFEQL